MDNGNSGLFKGTLGKAMRNAIDDLSLYERKLKEQMALLEAIRQEDMERNLYGAVVDLSHEILLIARELDKLGVDE